MTKIWSLRVQSALTSGEATPEQLAVLQDEATTLEIPPDGQLAMALVAADAKANPITCFCRALLKGSPTVECRQCGLALHQTCLAMTAKDFAASADSYVCAPCKRENLRGQRAAMPQGWDDFVDPSGRPIYIHLASKKTSWDMPPGSVRAGGVGNLAFVSNPSVERYVHSLSVVVARWYRHGLCPFSCKRCENGHLTRTRARMVPVSKLLARDSRPSANPRACRGIPMPRLEYF